MAVLYKAVMFIEFAFEVVAVSAGGLLLSSMDLLNGLAKLLVTTGTLILLYLKWKKEFKK